MTRAMVRIAPAAGLAVALLASAVALRAWLGERSLAQGRAAQRRGELRAADAAYGSAVELDNADAAVERARLQLVRQDWGGAEASVRAAMRLVPSRAQAHLLWARLQAQRPGPWDTAREELVLDACRHAVALAPASAETRAGCADLALTLAGRRRADGDAGGARLVLDEAAGSR